MLLLLIKLNQTLSQSKKMMLLIFSSLNLNLSNASLRMRSYECLLLPASQLLKIVMLSPVGPIKRALVPYQHTFLFFLTARKMVHSSLFEQCMVVELSQVIRVRIWVFDTTCLGNSSCITYPFCIFLLCYNIELFMLWYFLSLLFFV